MPDGMANIEHVVVLMLENRSLDNLLGWLYSDSHNRPPSNLPTQLPPSYAGLVAGKYSNTAANSTPNTVYAAEPTTAWPGPNNPMLVPDPDPGEDFDQMTRQLFGTSTPPPGAQADMSGFLYDYSLLTDAKSAPQIMQSYSPQQVGVISQLARAFAVCDHWFASAPCQTWPNRGFVHTGSSDGHINNDDYEPYDIPTIFNVMYDQGIAWGVYADTFYTPSLTHAQFPQLWDFLEHFHDFSTFQSLCRAPASAPDAEKLPAYSFVEPRFTTEWWDGYYYAEDYHPPNNVCLAERFLAEVYQAVRQSPYRDQILLVITFDEHGGCYDHVPPPAGAAPPEPGAVSRYGDFHFDRFGVRVPTILVSSYVQPGTVFRAPHGSTPYDHTSILATLRDWKNMALHPFLPSPRIEQAPTLDSVLTLQQPNTDWPSVTAACQPGQLSDERMLDQPLNDLQLGLAVSAATLSNNRQHIGPAAVNMLRQRLRTQRDLVAFMRPERERAQARLKP